MRSRTDRSQLSVPLLEQAARQIHLDIGDRPIVIAGQFRRLRVEHCTTSVVADKAWDEYQLDKDPEASARKRALFFRAIFVPSLAQALGPSRGPEERKAFGAALEAGLERRLVDHPTRIDHLVGMIVLAKQGAE